MENNNTKLKEVANSVARKAFDAITKQTGKKAEEITPYDIHNSPLLNNLQKRWAREYYLDMHPEVRADMEAEEKILMEKSIDRVERKYAKRQAKKLKRAMKKMEAATVSMDVTSSQKPTDRKRTMPPRPRMPRWVSRSSKLKKERLTELNKRTR